MEDELRLEEGASGMTGQIGRLAGLQLSSVPASSGQPESTPPRDEEVEMDEELRPEDEVSEMAGQMGRPSAAIFDVLSPQEEWATPAEWAAVPSDDEELRLEVAQPTQKRRHEGWVEGALEDEGYPVAAPLSSLAGPKPPKGGERGL